MPVLNPTLPGTYCAGRLGDGGIVSVNGVGILGRIPSDQTGSAGGADWLNSSEVMAQYYNSSMPVANLVAIQFTGGPHRVLWPAGVDEWHGAGGHFYVITTDHRVLLGNDANPPVLSEHTGVIAPMAWSWDGWLAYRRWHMDGLRLCAPGVFPDPDHDVVIEPDNVRVEDLQMHNGGGASYRVGREVRAFGLPLWPSKVKTLSGDFGWVRVTQRGAEWWLTYLRFSTNQIVYHRATDETTGHIIGVGPSYRLDTGLISGRTRFVWSAVDGDMPGDLRVFDLPDAQAEVPLAPPTPVPEPVTSIQSFEAPYWIAPLFSHDERWGDTPLEQHAGNAIILVERQNDLSVLPRDLARCTPLNMPLIVEGKRDIPGDHINLTVAWWMSGSQLADVEAAVAEGLRRPERPVIAYLDRRGWPTSKPGWITNRVWPGIQAYRDAGESLDVFDRAIRTELAHCATYGVAITLVPAFYTRNGTVPVSDILECMSLYEAWMREYPIRCFLPFADRRPTGMLDNPELRAWARKFMHAAPSGRPNRTDYWVPNCLPRDRWLNKLRQSRAAVVIEPDLRKALSNEKVLQAIDEAL